MLPLFDLDGHMSVDNQPRLAYAELAQDPATELRIVYQAEIGVLGLFMSLFVRHKVGFKRRHLIFAEERGERSPPEIPEPVRILSGMVCAIAEGASHQGGDGVEERSAFSLHSI